MANEMMKQAPTALRVVSQNLPLAASTKMDPYMLGARLTRAEKMPQHNPHTNREPMRRPLMMNWKFDTWAVDQHTRPWAHQE